MSTEIQTKQEKMIDQARKLLKPTSVKVGKIPLWLQKRLKQGHKAGKFRETVRFAGVADLLMNVAIDISRDYWKWLDHWGTTKNEAFGEVLVSEPYTFDSEFDADVREFCRILDLAYLLSTNSWHYPSKTFRITFFNIEDFRHRP